MSFNRNYLRDRYDEEPTWFPGSYLFFNTDLSDKDDTVATEYVQESMQRQVTMDEVRDWQEKHPKGDLNAWLTSRLSKKATIASKHAYLATKIVEWSGLDFVVDDDYEDASLDPIGKHADGTPRYPIHADAGKLAPITPFWVSMLGPAVVDRMWKHLRAKQEARSAEEQERFRLRYQSLEQPGGLGEGSEEESPAA